jgi:GTP-binding protein
VIVSEVPGTTRDSIDIPFVVGKGPQARHYILTDTAGLRPASKVDNAVEVFSQFRADKSIRRANVVLMVLDAEQGPTAQDKKIAAKVLEHERGCVVVVNKWDVAEKGGVTEREYMPALQEAVPFLRYCPVCFISAKTGYNIRRTVEALDHVAAQVNAELPTGILNRTIHDAWERVQPPAIKGKRLKLYYAAQVGRDPVRIRIFVNDPERVTPSYSEYLVRSLRERFGLEGAPVRIQFRRRTREPGRDAGG